MLKQYAKYDFIRLTLCCMYTCIYRENSRTLKKTVDDISEPETRGGIGQENLLFAVYIKFKIFTMIAC